MQRNLILICLLFCEVVPAQKAYNVLDWKPEYTLNTFLVQEMHNQYAQRQKHFMEATASKQLALAYMANCSKNYIALLGEKPELSPLNASITGTIEGDGYTIEKLVYESFKNHHVTASLYIPKGKGPFPAVLLFCGHEDVSKATASYQQTAILFVKHKFVVLVIDPVSQGERYQLTDAKGKPLTRGGTTEHTLLNQSSNLVGVSTPAYELWDNVRSLDYLVTRPEVDTAKIGCIGNSGGGMQTIYFAGFDKRIKVIAPCSYLATRERTLELSGAADGCAQMPGEGKMQLELSDYLAIAAPKPLLILAGRYDFIDYEGTKDAYEELKKIYTVLGQQEKISLVTVDDGHGISKPKREAAVTWFSRWLQNDATPVKEAATKMYSDKELFATNTGQVNTAFADEITIPERNISLYQSLTAKRNAFQQLDAAKQIATIGQLINMNTSNPIVNIEETGTLQKNGVLFHKLILRKQGEVPVPVLLAYPSGTCKKVIAWFNETGKGKIVDSLGLVSSYIQSGYAVVLADLRGMGETEDKPELNDVKYYNKEYRNAMLALHIGKPLIGQRTTDILSVLTLITLDTKLGGAPVEIAASGSAAVSAMHAMLINKGVSKLSVYNSIRSFSEVLYSPLQRDWYSYIIPNVLLYYDIPDLIKLIGETKILYETEAKKNQ